MPASALTAPQPYPVRPVQVTSRVFAGPTRQAAMAGAVAWLDRRGFSVGGMEGNNPRGVMFGRWLIAKWSQVSLEERRGLHGRIDWTPEGDARVELLPAASADAAAAFSRSA